MAMMMAMDVTPCSLRKFTDLLEESAVSIFRVED
jgi:hypothetical protein